MKKIALLMSLTLYISVAASSETQADCPMNIQPVNLSGKAASYENFDREKAEHLVRFDNGDLLLVRYNSVCELGIDITFLSEKGLNDRESRKNTAAWLISLFRNYEEFNQYIDQALQNSPVLENQSFLLSIPDEYSDEEHIVSLTDISVSDGFQSALFKHVMTYSWLPPSDG